MEQQKSLLSLAGPHTPEFDALTDKQKRFVTAMLVVGAKKDFGAEAARVAGYSPDCAKQIAYTLMRHPKVLAAIRREADLRLQGSVLLGTQVLEEIALDPMHKDRMKAAVELLNRGGMMLIQKIEHTHKDERTATELVNFIRNMAIKNGIDPATLLGREEPVPQIEDKTVDAQYTEIDPALVEIMGDPDAE